MEEDELAQINSEMRYIAIELMKIATRRRISFREVLNEFIQNVYTLKRAITRQAHRRARRRAKRDAHTESTAKKRLE